MARAIAKCRCEHCEQEFEKIAFKYNREQAESWREWAEENFTECPECYAKRVAAEKAKKAAEIIANEYDFSET